MRIADSLFPHNYADDNTSFFNSCDAFTMARVSDLSYLSACTFGAFVPGAGYYTEQEFALPVQQDI